MHQPVWTVPPVHAVSVNIFRASSFVSGLVLFAFHLPNSLFFRVSKCPLLLVWWVSGLVWEWIRLRVRLRRLRLQFLGFYLPWFVFLFDYRYCRISSMMGRRNGPIQKCQRQRTDRNMRPGKSFLFVFRKVSFDDSFPLSPPPSSLSFLLFLGREATLVVVEKKMRGWTSRAVAGTVICSMLRRCTSIW